jgi:hypothetical protein
MAVVRNVFVVSGCELCSIQIGQGLMSAACCGLFQGQLYCKQATFMHKTAVRRALSR